MERKGDLMTRQKESMQPYRDMLNELILCKEKGYHAGMIRLREAHVPDFKEGEKLEQCYFYRLALPQGEQWMTLTNQRVIVHGQKRKGFLMPREVDIDSITHVETGFQLRVRMIQIILGILMCVASILCRFHSMNFFVFAFIFTVGLIVTIYGFEKKAIVTLTLQSGSQIAITDCFEEEGVIWLAEPGTHADEMVNELADKIRKIQKMKNSLRN
jgi:hypothetical protein